MISRIALFILLFQCSSLLAQVSDSEMEKLKANWRVDLSSQGRELALNSSREEGMSDFSDSIRRLFLEDTFVVENLLNRQLQKESTTLGINKANLACASEYEQLAGKYYGILLSKMKEEDKEQLVSWQSAWKAMTEKERTFIGTLMQEPYSGGGSIQSITYTGRLKTLQKNHLLSIIDYLTHLI